MNHTGCIVACLLCFFAGGGLGITAMCLVAMNSRGKR